MDNRVPFYRLPLMAFSFLALFAGIWAGLLQSGWNLPISQASFPRIHGPLMIGGFFGMLISVVRAVAVIPFLPVRVRALPYIAPLVTGVGVLILLLDMENSLAPLFILFGSIGLVMHSGFILYRHSAFSTLEATLGALAWLIGNLIWLAGEPSYHVIPWWVTFLVFTTTGERLELARLGRLSTPVRYLFMGMTGVFLVGLVVTRINPAAGLQLMGGSQILLALWLLRYDLTRKTLHQVGLPRYVAACLLSGYFWLAISGGLMIVYGHLSSGPFYDAWLHTLFLGFVFSMIFGHVPLVMPAILNLPLVYRPIFYSHLVLLHLSLVLRLVGDLALWQPGRQWGGLLNAAVPALFLINTVVTLLLARRKDTPSKVKATRRNPSS